MNKKFKYVTSALLCSSALVSANNALAVVSEIGGNVTLSTTQGNLAGIVRSLPSTTTPLTSFTNTDAIKFLGNHTVTADVNAAVIQAIDVNGKTPGILSVTENTTIGHIVDTAGGGGGLHISVASGKTLTFRDYAATTAVHGFNAPKIPVTVSNNAHTRTGFDLSELKSIDLNNGTGEIRFSGDGIIDCEFKNHSNATARLHNFQTYRHNSAGNFGTLISHAYFDTSNGSTTTINSAFSSFGGLSAMTPVIIEDASNGTYSTAKQYHIGSSNSIASSLTVKSQNDFTLPNTILYTNSDATLVLDSSNTTSSNLTFSTGGNTAIGAVAWTNNQRGTWMTSTNTDGYGKITLTADNKALIFSRGSGFTTTLGISATHRLKELTLSGNSDITLNIPVYTQTLNVTNTGNITLSQNVDLNGGTLIYDRSNASSLNIGKLRNIGTAKFNKTGEIKVDQTGVGTISSIDLNNNNATLVVSEDVTLSGVTNSTSTPNSSKLKIKIDAGKTLTVPGIQDNATIPATTTENQYIGEIDFQNGTGILQRNVGNQLVMPGKILNAGSATIDVPTSHLWVLDSSAASVGTINVQGLRVATRDGSTTIFNNTINHGTAADSWYYTPVVFNNSARASHPLSISYIMHTDTQAASLTIAYNANYPFEEFQFATTSRYANGQHLADDAKVILDSTNATASSITYSIINPTGGSLNGGTGTDLVGIIELKANNKELTMNNSGGLASFGKSATYRAKELSLLGNKSVTLNLPVYSGKLTLNNSDTVNFGENVDLGASGNITVSQDSKVDIATGKSMSGASPTLELGAHSLTLSGAGKMNLSGTPTINTTYDGTNVGTITIDGSSSELDLSGATQLNVSLTATSTQTSSHKIITKSNSGTVMEPTAVNFLALDSNTVISWAYDNATHTATSSIVASNLNSLVKDAQLNPEAKQDVEEIIGNITEQVEAGDLTAQAVALGIGGIEDPEIVNAILDIAPTSTNNADQATSAADKAGDTVAARIGNLVQPNSFASLEEENQYIAGERLSGLAAGDNASKYGVWFSPFYNVTSYKQRGSAPKYSGHTYGGTIGADTVLSDETILGGAFSYLKNDHKYKGSKINDKNKTESWIVALYAHKEFGDYFVNGSIAGGKNYIKQSEHRRLSANQRAIAKTRYNFASYSANVTFGKSFDLDKKLSVTPSIGLAYYLIDGSKYNEDGAGLTNLSVTNKPTNIGEITLGAQFAFPQTWNGISITPELHGYISYDASKRTGKVTTRLKQGQNLLLSKKPKGARLFYDIGTEVTIQSPSKTMEYGVQYNLEASKDYTSHTGSLKIRVMF